MRKKVIIPTIALVAIMGAMASGVMPVAAQSPVYGNLVTKIAQRFNLPEEDVKQVFEEVKAQQVNERDTRRSEKLTNLVREGKITQSQKEAILLKTEEIKKQWSDLKDLSVADRKEKRKVLVDEISSWLMDRNLDNSYKQFLIPHMRVGFGAAKK